MRTFFFVMILSVFSAPLLGTADIIPVREKGALRQGYEKPDPYFRYDLMSPNDVPWPPKR